jgi:hypothetical protein
MKKNNFLFLLLILFSCYSVHNNAQSINMPKDSGQAQEAKAPLSPLKMAMNNIGANHVHIEYSAPSVRGRLIWGGLVPYDKIWVTGAHMATSVQFVKDLKIRGTKVPAGKYALFTIPGKESWTVIINKNWNQHQADQYKETDDVVRFNVVPETQVESTEQLTYEVIPSGNNIGTITMRWEKIKISFEVESAQ